jgi:RimJ/RimL family protein N-acetyltransferase
MASQWTIREATEADYPGGIEPLSEAVAAEGRWLATELPIDHAARRAYRAERRDTPWRYGSFVAVADDQIIGHLWIERARTDVAELGMVVAADWRGRGVGSALLEAGIDWARQAGAHKVALQVWPHNHRALALYEKYGFREEGRLVRHYRRKNGELWDAIVMGLVLDETSPSAREVEPQ